MTRTNSIAKIAAVAAMLGLVVMSFASFAAPASAATFTMNLTIGSTGAEVTALQTLLIGGGYSIPAGATGYFGVQTQAALAAFQAAHGIAPAVGYFGPSTRAQVNGMDGGPVGLPAGCTSTSGYSPVTGQSCASTGGSTTTGGLGGGEASLEDPNGTSGDDTTVSEGGTAKVAEFEFDVENGDVRIERLDLSFAPRSGAALDQTKPWKSFETVTILDEDGKELASEDVSNSSDWLVDTNNGTSTFRFSGLDYVVREGDKGKFIVEIEAQNGVVDSGNTDEWVVYIDAKGIRGTDGEGLTQELGNVDETVDFDIEEEGANEDLDIKTSSDDPDTSTLEVNASSKSDWYTIFVFDLESDGVDAKLNEIGVNMVGTGGTLATTINKMKVSIDGKEFTSYTLGTNDVAFDIDGDYTVDDGDRVAVEVMAEFKANTGGRSVTASTTGTSIDAEGSDDITVGGSATGKTHTLAVDGLNASFDSESASAEVDRDATPDLGTFSITVELTAFGDDIYVTSTGTTEDITLTSVAANTGFNYDLTGTSTAVTNIDSSADTVAATAGNVYVIHNGQSETFTLTVTGQSNTSIFAQLQLGAIQYGTDKDDVYNQTLYLNASDYKTTSVSLSN